MEYLRSFVIHSKASVLIGDKKNWTPLIILPFIRKYSSHPFVPHVSPLSTSCRHEEAKRYEDAKKGASSRPPAASQYFMQLASSPR